MKIDTKTIIIICLAIALCIVSWIAFKPIPKYDDTLAKHELDRLETENKALLLDAKLSDVKAIAFSKKIDSLQSLKPQIQTIYVTKYKEIDAASAGGVATEFSSVFANSGIK